MYAPQTAQLERPAIVRLGDRAPSAAMMRGALVVAALAADTTRPSRRAQDCIKRRGLEFAALPRDKASPNWLKIALNSR